MSRGVGAVTALATLILVIPAALAALGRARFGTPNPLSGIRPPWSWGDGIDETLRRPLEDDTVVDLILRSSLLAAWAAVAVLVVTTTLETAHLVRHRGLPTPRRRSLRWAQPFARFVASGLVALLPLSERVGSSPILAAAAAPPEPFEELVGSSTMTDAGHLVGQVSGRSSEPAPAPFPSGIPSNPRVEHPSPPPIHVVERGESIWSIAADLAWGDEASTLRVAERILDLNLGATMVDGETFSNPALIRPGWHLTLPDDAGAGGAPSRPSRDGAQSVDGPSTRPGSDAATIVVAPGDTLSSIAAEHLGDPGGWTSIADDNLGRTMTDGRTFEDPDLILPGWELVLPTTPGADAPPASTDRLDATDENDGIADRSADDDRAPLPPPTGAPETGPSAVPVETSASSTQAQAQAPDGDAALPITTDVTANSPTTSTSPVPAGRTPPSEPADQPAPSPAPTTLGWEHAGMLAGGLLAVAAARRRQRLRAARSRARPLEPSAEVADTERSLRSVTTAERTARLDVAVRAAAAGLLGSGVQPAVVIDGDDGSIEMVLTGPLEPPTPWEGTPEHWCVSPAVSIETLAELGRSIGDPCPALVAVGRSDHAVLLVDPEAIGSVHVDAPSTSADTILTSIATTLATSLGAETAHLVTVGLDPAATMGHRNAVDVDDAAAAVAIGRAAVGSTTAHELGSFELRCRRTGGEAWEPAVVIVSSAHASGVPWPELPAAGHGVALVTSGPAPDATPAVVISSAGDTWSIRSGDWSASFNPFGLDAEGLAELGSFVDHAERPTVVDTTGADHLGTPPADHAPTTDTGSSDDPEDPTFAVLVHLYGGVAITDGAGATHPWQKSKSVELIAWLATHRRRPTRTAARQAMWVDEVRNATFSNVVSEARRGLARLVPPEIGTEWIPRTMNEDLLLDPAVVTDVDLVRTALEAARSLPPDDAIARLRPAVERIDGVPFADTTYLWPDADGLVTDATLLATSACTELADHALAVGDTDLVFAATGRALAVLPGHEESIALRLRAHAARGDVAGVRTEWQSYERTLTADPWSDGEPSPDLLDLRRELLRSG